MESKPSNDDVVELAGDLLGMISIANDIAPDFDGCAISILRNQETGQLTGVILSPVDMHGDEPFPRYQVNPDAPMRAPAQQIALLS